MPLPLPAVDNRIARFFLLIGGNPAPVSPVGKASLGRKAPDEQSPDQFFSRKSLSELTFVGGEGWRLLYGIDQSADRCQEIGLLVQTKDPETGAWLFEHQAVFTCTECDFDPDRCTVTAKLTTNDPYRLLLENYDAEVNLLDCPAARSTVTAQLAVLAQGVDVEFKRIDKFDDQSDYIGKDGWTTFYTNSSITYTTTGGSPTSFVESRDMVIFRYIQRAYALPPVAGSPGLYRIVNRQDQGWSPIIPPGAGVNPTTVNVPTLPYVKTPDIQSFTPLRVTGVAAFSQTKQYVFGQPGSWQTLLSVPCGDLPSGHGYVDADWLRVSGPDGGYPSNAQGIGGANNAGGPSGFGGACLNARVVASTDNYRSLYWKFGAFDFKTVFPLLDGVHWLLREVGTPPTNAAGLTPAPIPAIVRLLPPLPSQLSTFYTASTNPATGETGEANELPRLVLAAGSDVKRFGASEPATRLLVSLKQLLNDLSVLHRVGWFIDPSTGWLRIEDLGYRETLQAAGAVKDFTAISGASLPRKYGYRSEQLPRYDEIVVANAQTENTLTGVYFNKDSFDYGAIGCVNSRESQNRATRTSTRLTGDITALVLSGGSIPDSAIAILAPDTTGRLSGANAALAPTTLLARYHRRGMAAHEATLRSGQAVTALSLRPQRVQEKQAVPLGTLRALPDFARITTRLGSDAQEAKAELDLKTGLVTADVWLVVPDSLSAAPTVSRQFDDSFPDSFA